MSAYSTYPRKHSDEIISTCTSTTRANKAIVKKVLIDKF